MSMLENCLFSFNLFANSLNLAKSVNRHWLYSSAVFLPLLICGMIFNYFKHSILKIGLLQFVQCIMFYQLRHSQIFMELIIIVKNKQSINNKTNKVNTCSVCVDVRSDGRTILKVGGPKVYPVFSPTAHNAQL